VEKVHGPGLRAALLDQAKEAEVLLRGLSGGDPVDLGPADVQVVIVARHRVADGGMQVLGEVVDPEARLFEIRVY
jgi:hypothetical protein